MRYGWRRLTTATSRLRFALSRPAPESTAKKPLTHGVWEARKLREIAAAKRVATQMGNQGHASESIRVACEYVWQGTLGDVTKVHCVSNRSFGNRDATRPPKEPVPGGLDWENWIGPAPFRDFHKGLHPFLWRGWRDFGTGSIGDMACHTMDGPVWALKLHEADSVEVVAEMGSVNKEKFSGHARIAFQFPKRGDLPPVKLTWWNGGNKDDQPPRPGALEEGRNQLTEGTYYYGSKGTMQTGSHCQGVRLLPESFHRAIPKPAGKIPRVPGHIGDFLRAVKDPSAPAPSSNFDYSARLTEIVPPWDGRAQGRTGRQARL